MPHWIPLGFRYTITPAGRQHALDLYKTIRILNDERERLDKLIASLEQLRATKRALPRRKAPVRRGRKGMNAAERREISERMRKYWAARRAAAGPSAATPSPDAAKA
jgi:hypothetical protein